LRFRSCPRFDAELDLIGRISPSLSATITTLRSPVRMTASDGTSARWLPPRAMAKASVANMPGFTSRRDWLELATRRACRCRCAFTSGRIALTRPPERLTGKAPATRASTAVPGRSHVNLPSHFGR